VRRTGVEKRIKIPLLFLPFFAPFPYDHEDRATYAALLLSEQHIIALPEGKASQSSTSIELTSRIAGLLAAGARAPDEQQ
jgi:hypothetical protein